MGDRDPYELFRKGDYAEARRVFEKRGGSVGDDRYASFCIASCLAAEGSLEDALRVFSKESRINNPNHLIYNEALCHYKLTRYEEALECVDCLLASCASRYPELYPDSGDCTELSFDQDLADGGRLSKKLQDSCLIEVLNLRAAISYKRGDDISEVQLWLNKVPVRREDQLDCVTLHNQSIFLLSEEPEGSLHKLAHLSKLLADEHAISEFVPPETIKNMLTIQIEFGQFEQASNLLKSLASQKNAPKYLTPEMNQLMQIQLDNYTGSSSYESLMRRLDNLVDGLLESGSKSANGQCNVLEQTQWYQSSILWQNGSYQALMRLLLRTRSALGHSVDWQTIMAHTLFETDTRYEDCLEMYEDFLPKSGSESLLTVDPMILGNLCVAYVLTGNNGHAESLIKDIEADENGDPSRASGASSLCIVNLIIGTLYCVKGNFEFGLSRMIKSLEGQLEQRLEARTWFYVKRCILALLDGHIKQTLCASDDLFKRVISFLIRCEQVAVLVEAHNGELDGRNSVAYEARQLRAIALKAHHD